MTSTLTAADPAAPGAREDNRIQPWKADPRYWQYLRKPVLLVGASDEDNLFNHPHVPPTDEPLAAHLDRMVAAGGNYVRNTMSSRDPGNVWPFFRDPQTGLYDLQRPGEEYFARLERFLQMTAERGIIVQIEIWDRFDYAGEPWNDNPFNPKNNRNYASAESSLPEKITSHPARRENPFFRALPEQDNLPQVHAFQQAHVRRIMEMTLRFDHVLYCISNETNDSEQWSRHWAGFIRELAAGRGVEVTEMWDNWDLRDPMHARTFDHPEVYSFVDVSQNSHQRGQAQWDNLQWMRQRLAERPRPINNVKMYGGRHGGGPEEGQHKLWRNVLGGAASARYHRPGGGMGLNDVTTTHLRSLKLVRGQVELVALEPANHLLSERGDDEAYLAAQRGTAYVLYCPAAAKVKLDLSAETGQWQGRWIHVPQSAWTRDVVIDTGARADIHTPDGAGPWVLVLQKPGAGGH